LIRILAVITPETPAQIQLFHFHLEALTIFLEVSALLAVSAPLVFCAFFLFASSMLLNLGLKASGFLEMIVH
jgi:hypothetical protein